MKEIRAHDRLLYRFKHGGEVTLDLTIADRDGEARRFLIKLTEKKGIIQCQKVR